MFKTVTEFMLLNTSVLLDLRKLAVTVTGVLAWLAVIMVFISSASGVYLIVSLSLFWLRGYIERKAIPTYRVSIDRQQ